VRPVALALLSTSLACSQGTGGSPADGGGCDGGCGAACRSLDDCDGGLGNSICVQSACQPAGGSPVFGVAHAEVPAAFGGDQAASLTVRVLADVRPDGSALDCPALLQGLDGGTLDPDDAQSVNALLAPYPVQVRLGAGQTLMAFEVQDVASGPSRLLLVEGFLRAGDAGAAAAGCASYDAEPTADGGTPSVGIVLSSW